MKPILFCSLLVVFTWIIACSLKSPTLKENWDVIMYKDGIYSRNATWEIEQRLPDEFSYECIRNFENEGPSFDLNSQKDAYTIRGRFCLDCEKENLILEPQDILLMVNPRKQLYYLGLVHRNGSMYHVEDKNLFDGWVNSTSCWLNTKIGFGMVREDCNYQIVVDQYSVHKQLNNDASQYVGLTPHGTLVKLSLWKGFIIFEQRVSDCEYRPKVHTWIFFPETINQTLPEQVVPR